jgi:hypothetical protein
MISGTPPNLNFTVLAPGQELKDVANPAKFILSQAADKTWQINQLGHPPGQDHINILKRIVTTDATLQTQLDAIQAELTKAANMNDTATQSKINDLVTQVDRRLKSLHAIEEVNSKYAEMFSFENKFQKNISLFLNFMDKQGLATISDRKQRKACSDFLQ